ncbi:MAG: hypothetical protein AB1733_17275 [Thermodesulfobacteriota bacterium]
MKKSLLLLVALVTTLAFAGTACAWWDCYEMPPAPKVVCKDEVLCKGQAKGAIKLCGPCAPTIKYAGKWITMCVCPKPEAAKPAKKAKKVKK